jgi:hypothetical protein
MTIRDVTEDEKAVTLDSKLVPHITNTVVEALKKVNVAKRNPADMMMLSTGLHDEMLFDSGRRRGRRRSPWSTSSAAWSSRTAHIALRPSPS